MIKQNTIYHGSAIEVLKTFPDNSIDCCITSPPYWGLRDYGTSEWTGGDEKCDHLKTKDLFKKYTGGSKIIGGLDGQKESAIAKTKFKDVCKKCGAKRADEQLGLEVSPEKYVSQIADLFDEVKRVLKKEGTLWLNLGDSYAGNNSRASNNGRAGYGNKREGVFKKEGEHLKNKDLVGIPWMVAFELRKRGWYLRQDIIWSKPNPMPESVTDRCTKSHEYIFLMTKNSKYYYDAEAIKTPVKDDGGKKRYAWGRAIDGSIDDKRKGTGDDIRKANLLGLNGTGFKGHSGNYDSTGRLIGGGKANKRSVWTITTKPFKGAHFATFPEKLIEPCVKAGCPENGVILDPFGGAATVAVVARKFNRNFVLIELNKKYIALGEARLREEIGLFI